MPKKERATADRVRSLLDYDLDTGWLIWKQSTSNRVSVGRRAGNVNSLGYRQIMIDGVNYSAHRLIWLHVRGVWPEHEIDHINGVRDDNRLSNLRSAGRSCNARNAAMQKNNTSGFKGVSWNKQVRKWRARIVVNGVEYPLGDFDQIEMAAAAREKAAHQLHGEFACDGKRP